MRESGGGPSAYRGWEEGWSAKCVYLLLLYALLAARRQYWAFAEQLDQEKQAYESARTQRAA